jgi:hypothetical protein
VTITARFASICPACQQPIPVGAPIEWTRGQPAQHAACAAAPLTPFRRIVAEATPQTHSADDLANVAALIAALEALSVGAQREAGRILLRGGVETRADLSSRQITVLSARRESPALVAEAEAAGWTVEWSPRGHVLLTAPETR